MKQPNKNNNHFSTNTFTFLNNIKNNASNIFWNIFCCYPNSLNHQHSYYNRQTYVKINSYDLNHASTEESDSEDFNFDHSNDLSIIDNNNLFSKENGSNDDSTIDFFNSTDSVDISEELLINPQQIELNHNNQNKEYSLSDHKYLVPEIHSSHFDIIDSKEENSIQDINKINKMLDKYLENEKKEKITRKKPIDQQANQLPKPTDTNFIENLKKQTAITSKNNNLKKESCYQSNQFQNTLFKQKNIKCNKSSRPTNNNYQYHRKRG